MVQTLRQIVRTVVPRPVIRALKKKPVVISPADVELVISNNDSKGYESLMKKVSRQRSVYDEMYTTGSHYLQVGLSALQCIEHAGKESNKNDFSEVLDMACGHGRVLRFLAERFPDAELTAIDTNRDGVDFCRQTFGAYPVYANHTLQNFRIQKRFDLIWCGSLATHFNAEGTSALLKFFYDQLHPGGLLVFSMHGNITTRYLKAKQETYNLDSKGIQKVLSESETSGYGYADYPGDKGYGISIAKPEWMQATLSKTGNWTNYNFYEGAWTYHHDVYSVVKAG